MTTPISLKIQKLYKKLGFKLEDRSLFHARKELNENEHISVDFGGTVYVHKGFNKCGTIYCPICVNSFSATTPAEIEVLVKPLIK